MKALDRKLTPLEKVIGQKVVVERLKVFARSDRRLPSILLTAPSGYGKNRITEAFAEEANATLYHINAVNIDNGLTLNQMMREPYSNEEGRSLICIDESGEIKRKIDTMLLTALESPYTLETRVKRGKKVEVYRIKIPKHMSFILCTTHMGRLSKALINRCIHIPFDDYEIEEFEQIAAKYFNGKGFNPDADALKGFATVSRSVRQLLQVCDCAMIYNNKQIGISVLNKVLAQLQLTASGLTKKDTKLLNYLANRSYASERDCLAYLQVEKEEYRLLESWLTRGELIEVSSHGRSITTKGLMEIGCDARITDNGIFGERIDA
jgi:Holliday junction resolvasome RuvABC ATP-dependent DNA helicase subunit